jgi:quercetin dioxygenase-like cupin family protein
MSSQTAPIITKVDLLATAQTEALFVVGKAGDVVLAINSVVGGMPTSWDWSTDDEVEYHYCVRGTLHWQFKHGDQELPAIDVNAGEILTIPAGVAAKGSCSDDTVVLIMERTKSWHA